MSAARGRLAFIDALKAIASQLIVLHHLAFYGPMSDYAIPFAPDLIAWLSQHARIAVQAFLVMGGFLAAQALARDGRMPTHKPLLSLILKRYLKLVIPFLGALLLAIVCAAIARNLITHDSIPDAPKLSQLIAHAFLLHSVFGFDGLSAGVWYVAIDFQLYTLLLISLWLSNKTFPHSLGYARLIVAALMAASLFYFNRDAGWDNWAVYFFGAYGLGALSYWSVQRRKISPWFLLIAALTAGALFLDFRSRIAVALLVAVALGITRFSSTLEGWPKSKILAWLGQISYSVFLVHFSICMLFNALFERFAPHTPGIQFSGMIIAWVASIVGGALFHRAVECRAQAFLSKKKPAPASKNPVY